MSTSSMSLSPSSPLSTNSLQLAYRSPPKANTSRPRRPAPKVKTGCITCKVRRVKCDERKPQCQRCIKFGIKCDGYPSKKKSESIQKKAILLPKLNKPPTWNPSILMPRPVQSGVRFDSPMSSQCFHMYLSQTARNISGPFPSTLWTVLIPQISEIEPFVRHAVIAIGALSAQQKSQPHHRSPGSPWNVSDYELALREYGKAIRGMREAIENGQHDLRKALLACLLVFCFESMIGNQVSATIHAESGWMLLHEWSTNKNSSGNPWLTDKAWDENVLERDLLEAFSALDLQILLFIDNRNKAVHQQVKTAQNRLVEMMPQEFYNLDFAKQFWRLIMNRNYHFNKSMQPVDLKRIQEERAETPWEGSANMKGELLLSNPAEAPSPVKEEYLRYVNDINRWNAATSKLFAEIAIGTDESEKVAAAMLQVQAKINHIMLVGTFLTSETGYDVFFPEFIAIVELSELILPYILSSHSASEPRFHFDIGIVPALFLVGSRCRVDSVRRRAIDMLINANYREAIWDAPAVGHVARWLRSLEVESVEDGDPVPEEKRVVLTAINIDLYNKRAILGATQKTGVQRKTMLTW